MTAPRILVTGAAGLIGGTLVRRLFRAGHDVVATDRRAFAAPAGVTAAPADLEDAPGLARLMRRERIHQLVHCGAVSGPMVEAGPYAVMAVNVGGTLNVAEAARLAGVDRMVALSSAAVYGTQATRDPVQEDAPLAASDVYGASKVAAEAVLRAYRSEHALPVTVLRASSVFGPGRVTACFIGDMIRHAASREPLPIATGDDCRRQFVHVEDVVAAIVAALQAPRLPPFAVNVGGGTWLTEPELVSLASPLLPGLRIAAEAAPPRCLDGRMGPLNLTLAETTLGYRPSIDLAQGITAYAAALTGPSPFEPAGKLFA